MNFSITNQSFIASSPDVLDGCIQPGGPYKLLRFDFKSRNHGNADAVMGPLPPVGQSNSIYVWSPAHNHHHVRDFNFYDLIKPTNRVNQAPGLKQAFCLMDIEKHDPNAPGAQFNCSNQGLTRGWTDVYNASLPCQFINITNVPNGTYVLVARTNASKVVPEADLYDNGRLIRLNINGTTVTTTAPLYEGSVEVVPPNASGLPQGAVVSWGTNRYDLFYRNPTDGRLYHKYQDPSGGGWFPSGAGEIMAGPTIVGQPTVTSWDVNRLDIFARTSANNVGHWWWANGWGFEEWPFSLTASPAAISPSKDRIMVILPSPFGNLQARWWNGSSWQQRELGGGTFAAEPPAMAFTGSGHVHLMERDTGGRTWHRHFNAAQGWTNGWSSWIDMGGILTAPPSAASWNVNRIDVVGRGTDNGLYRTVWTGSSWTGWFFDGVGSLAAGPVIISTNPDRLDVLYYENISGTIFHRHRRWNGSTWVATLPAAPASISTSVNLYMTSFGEPHWGLFTTHANGSIRMRQFW